MTTQVIMPQLGESVVEGTVSRWLKKEGEAVNEYDPLLEVSTDKVDTEIPAPAGGVVLKIYVEEGETVERGALLALIGEPGEAVADHDDQPAAEVDHRPKPAPVAMTSGARDGAAQPAPAAGAYTGHVTPVVARMITEHNLDLSQIEGTGRNGRVTKKDVEAYLETRGAAPVSQTALPPWEQPGTGDLFKPSVEYDEMTSSAPARAPAAPPSAPTVRPAAPASSIAPSGVPGELVQLTTMRRAIADHMVRSKLQTSPHVTSVFEVDMTAVLEHRAAHKAEFARNGVNLTLTAYFSAAAVVALQQNPYLNAQWTEDGIFLHHTVNLGMAVAIDDGLIVPVIKNAQEYSLLGLARVVNDLTERARSRQLKPDEVQGGTFTITNHGVSGSLFATPIINQPQVGILGIGIMEKRVKVINDAIAIRPCVYVSLTFDHRVADGATGDAFLMTLKQTLENWA